MSLNRKTVVTYYTDNLNTPDKWIAFFIKEGEKEINIVELIHTLNDLDESVTGLTESTAVSALFMTEKERLDYDYELGRIINKSVSSAKSNPVYKGESLIKIKKGI